MRNHPSTKNHYMFKWLGHSDSGTVTEPLGPFMHTTLYISSYRVAATSISVWRSRLFAFMNRCNVANECIYLIISFTWLCAGLHVLWPVSLLAGVIAVACVPTAVEDSLFPAVSTPLFLLGLIHRLLLLHLHLFLHLSHQPLPLLLQTLPHLRLTN